MPRKSGTIVEVDHKVRGKYLTAGSPIKFSGMQADHTYEALAELGYTKEAIAMLYEARAI